jgi:putative ABC transport system ATP-binding protein
MIKIKNLTKTYTTKDIETPVLRGIDLDVKEGEFLAIMGKSGAGKSTLMYQIGLLDHPTSGEIVLNDTNTEQMSTEERTQMRLSELGYVFQDYALIPELTAAENVMIPLLMKGLSKVEAREVAKNMLERIGLLSRIDNKPSQLSGGEQQRTAVARAIAHGPKILFADEPTANLDLENSARVIEIFKKLNSEGLTIVMVTHEDEYGALADRVIRLSDGVVVN